MKESFDALAWDAWRRREIEKFGNCSAGWIAVSRNLVASGAILKQTYTAALAIILRDARKGGSETDPPRTSEEEGVVTTGHQTHSVALMLFGFAIECLLKGLFVQRGGILYEDGRFKRPKKLDKSHNLLELAKILGCASLFNEHQQDILDLLSARSYGFQPAGPNGPGRFYGIWGAQQSETVFDVLKVLYEELGENVPISAGALLEEGRVARSAHGEARERRPPTFE